MRFLTLSFAYGDPMWDTAPLQSHYNTNKVRETELAHGRQQMKLLADRLEQQSNPTHPKSGSQRLPRVVSMNDETDDDDDNTTRRYVKSFRRILREHTDNDINYRTDEDGDPDFPPPPKPFPQEGTIDQIEAVDLTEGTEPTSPPPPMDSTNRDEPTTWHTTPQHTPSPPPSPLPQTPEPRSHESSPVIEGRFSPPITPVTPVNPVVVIPTNEHESNNDDRVVPEMESKTKDLPVLKSSKPPLSVPLPMPVVSSPPRADSVPVVSSPPPNLRHELPSIRPECLSRQCGSMCRFRHCLTCNEALASDCPVDSQTCSLRCTRKDEMLVYLLSGGEKKDNEDKDKKRSNTKEENQEKKEKQPQKSKKKKKEKEEEEKEEEAEKNRKKKKEEKEEEEKEEKEKEKEKEKGITHATR